MHSYTLSHTRLTDCAPHIMRMTVCTDAGRPRHKNTPHHVLTICAPGNLGVALRTHTHTRIMLLCDATCWFLRSERVRRKHINCALNSFTTLELSWPRTEILESFERAPPAPFAFPHKFSGHFFALLPRVHTLNGEGEGNWLWKSLRGWCNDDSLFAAAASVRLIKREVVLRLRKLALATTKDVKRTGEKTNY